MVKAEIDVTVFVPDATISSFEVIVNEDKVRIVKFSPNYSGKADSLGYVANLSLSFAEIVKKFIKSESEPNFIEAQDYLGIAYYLLQYKLTSVVKLEHVPIVLTLHSPAFIYLDYNRVPTYRFPEFWTCEMEKSSILSADILISPTQFLVDEIQKYVNIDNKTVHVIPNPFVSNEYTKPFSFQRNKVVYYGKLSPQKGTFQLLEYFDELWREGNDYKLTIIGGTDIVYYPEFRTMGQIVEERYGNYISSGLLELKGKISPNKISEYLDDAHLILVPSIVDNLPYVVLEAMANKRPVLASVQGGQREIITDGVNGFLFDHSEPGSFSSKLLKVLQMNEEQLTEITTNAFAGLDRYYPDYILTKKLDVLKNFTIEGGLDTYPFEFQEDYTSKTNTLNDDLLSVVIPYFNMGEYIEECVESVLSSDYTSLEVIIVNDGSTDRSSLNKLEEIKSKSKVVILNQRNSGVADARNFGAENANGRFLAFLDADDKVSRSYYSKAIAILNQYKNVFFVGCWVKYFGDSSQIWPTLNPQPPYLLVHNTVNSSALVYERNAFLLNGKNDKFVDYGLEDYESVLNMVSCGFNGVVIPEVHFHYRIRPGSMIRKIRTEKWLYSYSYIAKKHEQYFKSFATSVINIQNANGPGFTYDNPTLDEYNNKFKLLVPYMKRLVTQYPGLKKPLLSAMQLFKLNK
ncbi:glycosyltransferase [Rufibacter sp. H-1]|uniref:Glycosyltransferase n=2 Tax=Rufibacter sediminis TaxID=2762756 RepID=A0ABR6VNJ8_9BACT|nr:glycosyltransferase [Rufibacter sediminis]